MNLYEILLQIHNKYSKKLSELVKSSFTNRK